MAVGPHRRQNINIACHPADSVLHGHGESPKHGNLHASVIFASSS